MLPAKGSLTFVVLTHEVVTPRAVYIVPPSPYHGFLFYEEFALLTSWFYYSTLCLTCQEVFWFFAVLTHEVNHTQSGLYRVLVAIPRLFVLYGGLLPRLLIFLSWSEFSLSYRNYSSMGLLAEPIAFRLSPPYLRRGFIRDFSLSSPLYKDYNIKGNFCQLLFLFFHRCFISVLHFCFYIYYIMPLCICQEVF